MSQPFFTIATPARNALAQLKRCVGSVRGQTGVTWEHRVQDACSSDGTPAWLQAQQPLLHGISEADAGMYDAINRAWTQGRGEVFSWLNADEQYLPGTLARVQQCFANHPEVDVLFADYLVADDQGHAVALRREIPFRRFYVANSFLNAQSCTLFFRRRLWDRGLLNLDSRLRYAADKALMLDLARQGVRMLHVPELWSVFGVDGSNLSTHARMEEEAEAIRRAHGALAWRPLRQLALAGRRMERLLRGSYRAMDITYRFALDEVPHYATFVARGIGGRYDLARPQGRAERVPEPQA